MNKLTFLLFIMILIPGNACKKDQDLPECLAEYVMRTKPFHSLTLSVIIGAHQSRITACLRSK